MPKHIIIGGAGVGKTYNLIDRISREVNNGTPLNRIAFVTFSKAAAEEARERLIATFNCEKRELDLCGTIHSICYKRFCKDKKVIKEKHKRDFFKLHHLDYEIRRTGEDLMASDTNVSIPGNLILNFYDKIRMGKCKNITDIKSERELKDIFSDLNLSNFVYTDLFCNDFNMYTILKEYNKYLEDNDLIDFAEMLLTAYKGDYTIDADVLVLDEAQDLSPLQFFIFRQWSRDKKEIYISGDPNQTIYIFNLANADYLINEIKNLDHKNGDEHIVLPKTYRMAEKINSYCSEYINKNMRKTKYVHSDIEPARAGGEIIEEDVDGILERVTEWIDPNESTFILTRTNYYKKRIIEDVLLEQGIPYLEIKGKSIWSIKATSIFNMVIKLVERKPITGEEASLLFEAIPFKLGLMKRGSKAKFKKIEKKQEYKITDLINAGFNLNFLNFLSYDKIYNILDISDPAKIAFENATKEPVGKINLRIGTCHSAKGKECSVCIIFKDISKKIANEVSKSQDAFESEIRVFYVGQSRAKNKLVILRGGFRHSERYIIP